ncbi:MAG: chorismate-binding protein [Flavobacteriales bacterium]|jgi:isochorismate synthase|nr:chorismate-binding protein [Flavobacteriales bacterium]
MSLQNFHKKLQFALDEKRPFVAYKLPNDNTFSLQIQKDDTLFTSENLGESGFVFAPFRSNEKKILMPFDDSDLERFELTSDFLKEDYQKSVFKTPVASLNKTDYIHLAKKAIHQIKAGAFEKVVLSRKISLAQTDLDLKSVFIRLALKYTNAMTYFWHHPKVGTWLGATPEKLISLSDNCFETMALAGTQLFKENEAQIWMQKEKDEQQIVVDYISKSLESINIPAKLSKPFSLKAGQLTHICTEITGHLSINTNLLDLVKCLHPTPAVAGYPKQKAIDFILENENYNREFYTGYFGFINKDKSSKLFVNLRCMQIEKKKLSVYVGGGITKDSNPLNEWQETEDKSKTLLSVL